jgi:hypothetical protein
LLYQLSYRISKLAGLAVAYRCNRDAKVRDVPLSRKKISPFFPKKGVDQTHVKQDRLPENRAEKFWMHMLI